MKEVEWGCRARDGTELHLREWRPEGAVRAVVSLVHGLGDHSGCFTRLTEFFVKNAVSVVAIDLHGNGKSGGKRGDIRSPDVFMDDIAVVLGEAESRYAGVPRFLYGHSLGGGLVLNYLLRRGPSLSGCIASSPWLALAGDQSRMIRKARIVSRFLPRYTIDAGINAKVLSHDTAFVDSYASDPLVHGLISVRLLSEVSRAAEWATLHASELATPTLIMHSPVDALTSFEASRAFAQAAGPQMCTFKQWDGAFHSLHNEVNAEEIFTYVLGWMEKNGKS
jgi:alpha-beta hydrolase superfamily lysophospholipase